MLVEIASEGTGPGKLTPTGPGSCCTPTRVTWTRVGLQSLERLHDVPVTRSQAWRGLRQLRTSGLEPFVLCAVMQPPLDMPDTRDASNEMFGREASVSAAINRGRERMLKYHAHAERACAFPRERTPLPDHSRTSFVKHEEPACSS